MSVKFEELTEKLAQQNVKTQTFSFDLANFIDATPEQRTSYVQSLHKYL